MIEYFEPLNRLRTCLEGQDAPMIRDDLATFAYRIELSQDLLVQLPIDTIQECLTAYGTALTAAEIHGPDGELLPLTFQTVGGGEYREFVADSSDAAKYSLLLRIDKARLVSDVLGDTEGRVLIYFESKGVLDSLAGSILDLERDWFREGRKLFVLFPNPTCLLVGPLLHIMGGAKLQTVRRFAYEPVPESLTAQLVKNVRMRSEETSWQSGPRFLLPEYLFCEDQGSNPDTTIKPILDRRFAELFVCSIANYSQPSGSGWLARVEGRKRMDISTSEMPDVAPDVSANWYALYSWIYESRSRDRIGIVRNLITLEAAHLDTGNCNVLINLASNLLRSAEGHFERLIGETVKDHFDKLKEAAVQAQGKVDAIGQQINSLIDAFLKNLLATAGFLISTVLTKIIDPTYNKVYPFIASAFAIYLIISTVVYYPVTWCSFKYNRDDYERNERSYERMFGKDDLEQYIGTSFHSRKKLFKVTFSVTLGLYIILALVSGYLATSGHLAQLVGASSQTARPSISISGKQQSPSSRISAPANRDAHSAEHGE